MTDKPIQFTTTGETPGECSIRDAVDWTLRTHAELWQRMVDEDEVALAQRTVE